MVFLALEHLFRHLCWKADAMGLVVRVFSVPGFVADAWVSGGGGGCGAGVGSIGRFRVVCLSDGILDEARCCGFVDCELACARCAVIIEWMNILIGYRTRYGRLAGSSASLILSKYCRTLSYMIILAFNPQEIPERTSSAIRRRGRKRDRE